MNSERLTSLLAAFTCLVIIFVFFGPRHDAAHDAVSKPTSTDAGDAGLKAVFDWLAQSQVPRYSWRRRYDQLENDGRWPSRGNLLVVSIPQRFPARHNELLALRDWLRFGNSVLVFTPFGDEAAWSSFLPRTSEVRRFLTALGLENVEADSKNEDEAVISIDHLAPREKVHIKVEQDHPAAVGIEYVAVTSDAYRTPNLPAHVKASGLAVPLVVSAEGEIPLVYTSTRGQGYVWFSHYAGLFSNSLVGEAGNSRLLANTIALSLEGSGAVIFDDMHQGISELYDPEAFFADTRLHATVGFLIAFWLLHVVGRSGRLGPYRCPLSALKSQDYLASLGNAYARNVTDQDVGKTLFKHFFNDVRRRFGLPQNGEPVWDLLAGLPRASPPRIEKLKVNYAGLTNSRVNLVTLNNELQLWRKEGL